MGLPFQSLVPAGRRRSPEEPSEHERELRIRLLTTLLSTEFAVPADAIGPETRLADLDLDSVGLVELAVALEERFDVDFTTGDTVITMQDRIGDLVGRLTAGHPTTAP